MMPSQQITALINRLHKFNDEAFSAEIQAHIQSAFEHLEETQLTLESAGL